MPIAHVADRQDYTDWLNLSLVHGITPRVMTQLLTLFATPQAIHHASELELSNHLGTKLAQKLKIGPDPDILANHLKWLEDEQNHLLTFADADYPRQLLTIGEPPPVLFLKGQRELLAANCVAVVGSRNATEQGVRDAQGFARALSQAGLCIVSGLALGIDAAAHKGGLEGLGSSMAVVGTGLDRIYPARNESLARQLAQAGLIITEFPLGTPPLRENFPKRNRIISGLSRGVLVVEAALQSGSLITARLAAEQGRDVFAIPGSIHSPFSKGCHSLIKSGAKLVDEASDILDELQIEHVAPVKKAIEQSKNKAKSLAKHATGDEKNEHLLTPENRENDIKSDLTKRILKFMGHELMNLDALCLACEAQPHEVLSELTILELQGKIAQLPGGRFQQLF